MAADRIQLTSIQLGSDATLQWDIVATPLCVNYETAIGVRRTKRQSGKQQASMKAAFGSCTSGLYLFLHLPELHTSSLLSPALKGSQLGASCP